MSSSFLSSLAKLLFHSNVARPSQIPCRRQGSDMPVKPLFPLALMGLHHFLEHQVLTSFQMTQRDACGLPAGLKAPQQARSNNFLPKGNSRLERASTSQNMLTFVKDSPSPACPVPKGINFLDIGPDQATKDLKVLRPMVKHGSNNKVVTFPNSNILTSNPLNFGEIGLQTHFTTSRLHRSAFAAVGPRWGQ